MKKSSLLIVFSTFCLYAFGQLNCVTTVDYGNNITIGKYARINGIKMYYETYGDSTKQPLLLIHGNGGSIYYEGCQIEYFKDTYYVIIADSRYQGKSGNGNEELTYRLMSKDYNALLDELKLDSLYIIGQSDGGIIGLLLAIDYPSKVKKLITTAPNLRPDSTAVYEWAIKQVKSNLLKVEEKLESGDRTIETIRKNALLNLMDKYPNISLEKLKRIRAPVLVMSSDADIIKPEHILEIYNNIPKAQLFVMPGATHRMYREEPELFNQIALRFLENPFKRPTPK